MRYDQVLLLVNEAEYETMYRVEDVHWWYRGLRKLVQSALPRRADSRRLRVLDVGCGTGATLAMLSRDHDAFGIDLSPLAINRCRRRGLNSAAQADALALPYLSASFDVVLMLDVLYHTSVPDRTAALIEAARVLSPGGSLVANLPAYQWLCSSHDAAIHTARRFTRPEVLALLRAAGLTPRRVTYWNTLLFPAIAFVRMMRRRPTDRGSDLEGYTENVMAKLLGSVLALERAAMKLANLPFGLSIFAVAEKRVD